MLLLSKITSNLDYNRSEEINCIGNLTTKLIKKIIF